MTCSNSVGWLVFVFSIVHFGSPLAYGLEALSDKTLVAWVALADLDQRGGSALTIDDGRSHFDAIVFGEIEARKWMAGSDAFRRTLRDQSSCAPETAAPETFVQVAMVYQGKRITVYRNGEVYSEHDLEAPQSFGKSSLALFGKRHLDTQDPARLRGRIDDARIYDFPLTPEQLGALRPNQASQEKPIAWWSFDAEGSGDRMGSFPESYLTGGARIAEGCLVLAGDSPMMVAAPEGLLESVLATSKTSEGFNQEIVGQRKLRELVLRDPHRPVYHFVSPEGRCMPFDPNGAIYWNGEYHLCYIFQDERGHCWGHASSVDLLHWRWHTPALFPAPGDVDTGIFSGNCFVNKEGEATLLYHGVGAGNCIATSSGPGLDHWTKLASNPIIPIPQKGSPEEALYSSWDPHGWLEGDTYYAIFGGINPTLFKGPALDDWKYVGPLLDQNMPDVDDFEDISCPDFFEIGGKQMLLCISHSRGCRYYLGEWKEEKFHPEFHARMNWPGGTCFAPESLLDHQGRRIMWAWVLDRRPKVEYGWSGTMTLPRVLSLDGEGVLNIDPPAELSSLRTKQKSGSNLAVKPGQPVLLEDIRGDTLEIEMEIDPGKAETVGVTVLRSPDGEEETRIVVDLTAGQIKIDFSKSSLDTSIKHTTFCMRGEDNHEVTEQVAPFSLKAGEDLKLRIYLDRSILEVFANSRQCITQRVYPTRRDSLGVELFSSGGDCVVESMKAWELAATNPW